MVYATLAPENRINAQLGEMGLAGSFLCAVADIPATRLSQALRGIKPLDNDDARILLNLLDELRAWTKAFEPVPFALDNPTRVKAFLKIVHDLDLTTLSVEETIGKMFAQQAPPVKAGDLVLPAPKPTAELLRAVSDLDARYGKRLVG